MNTIKEKWVKTYGYTPTDKEENQLIKHFKL